MTVASFVRSAARAVVLVAAAGCGFDSTIPEAAQITCAEGGECPPGYVCREAIGRCVRTDGDDTEAPYVTEGAEVSPEVVGLAGDLHAFFQVSEALGADPVVYLTTEGGQRHPLVRLAPEEWEDPLSYHYAYRPTGEEPQKVRHDVRADLIDQDGNEAQGVDLGRVWFDFEAPVPEAVAVANDGHVRAGAAVDVTLTVSEELDGPPWGFVGESGLELFCEPDAGALAWRCAGVAVPELIEPGVHDLVLAMSDPAGNLTEHRVPAAVTVDFAPPVGLPPATQGGVRLFRAPRGAAETDGVARTELRICGAGAAAWAWCPADAAERPDLLPGDLLGVYAAEAGDGGPVCTETVLAAATVGPDAGAVTVALDADVDAVCAGVRDLAGNLSERHVISTVEWVATFGPIPDGPGVEDPSPHRFEARRVFDGRIEGNATDDGSSAAALAVPDGACVETLATGRWLSPSGELPLGRYDHGMAFDARRGRVVLFGGGNPLSLGDLWEWDGVRWWAREDAGGQPGGAPEPRSALALTYDTRRGRTILFGGAGGDAAGGVLNDTWEWDGKAWHRGAAGEAPPARRAHALAYDPRAGETLLFGGEGPDGQALDDLWAWDGETWTPRAAAGDGVPSARTAHAMVWDVVRGGLLLHGGDGTNGLALDETWLWDGEVWTQAATADGAVTPGPRHGHRLVWDGGRERVLLFGGSDGATSDVWAWDGETWAALSDQYEGGPGDRRASGLGFDELRGRLVLFGGQVRGYSNGTWEWDGEDWALAAPADGERSRHPQARSYSSLGCDAGRGRCTLFGGHVWSGIGDGWVAEAWEWDGRGWDDASMPAEQPSARSGQAVSFHAARGELLLFGGYGAAGRMADLWSWNGAEWTRTRSGEEADLTQPGARNWHALAYDAQRERVVLFGGRAGDLAADTWEWTGESWEDKTPAEGSPPARDAHALAWDALRGRTVLFGGRNAEFEALGATWEWDGLAWTRASEGGGPPARLSHSLVWDGVRGRVVLFGGGDGAGEFYSEVWEWDGVEWTAVEPADPEGDGGPTNRLAHAAALDPTTGRTLVFGGHAARLDVRFGDTWLWESPARQRPAHAMRLRTSFGRWSEGVSPELLRVHAVAEGSGQADGAPAAGVELLLWEHGRWVAVAGEAVAGEPALTELTWETADPVAAAGLLVGEPPELIASLVPTAASGTSRGTVRTDYFEARLRYTIAPGEVEGGEGEGEGEPEQIPDLPVAP